MRAWKKEDDKIMVELSLEEATAIGEDMYIETAIDLIHEFRQLYQVLNDLLHEDT
jgi:hypothetical protein